MNYDIVECKIPELCLDQENPRLPRVASQNEALAALIELNDKHFRTIMLSIKENGLDPGDSFYIIEDPEEPGEDYIALDGNRRLSALLILSNPSRLDGLDIDDKVKKRLRSATNGFVLKAFGRIRCVLFENRADANEWIERRHIRGAEGEGRITWGYTEIRRFKDDMLIEDALNFAGENADYSEDDWQKTRDLIESKKGTVIGRILKSSAGKQHLGLDMLEDDNKEIPTSTRSAKFVFDVIKRIIDDAVAGEIDTRSLNKASEIEDYLKNLPDELQPSEGSEKVATPLREPSLKKVKKKGQKTESASASGEKKKRVPRQRVTLAPRQVTFSILQHPKFTANLVLISGH